MSARVLIDTSAWIQLLRDGEGPAVEMVMQVLRDGLAAISGPVATELMRGARGPKEQAALEELFALLHWFDTSRDTYRRAGDMGYALAHKGKGVPTIDLVLAEVAIENGASVLSLDGHFTRIAERFPLKLIGVGG